MTGLATIPRPTAARTTAPVRRSRGARIRSAARMRSGRGVAPGTADRKEWITKRELSAHLKMTTRWIELQQRLGMPFLPCGTANRYRIHEVEAWIGEYYGSRRRNTAGRSAAVGSRAPGKIAGSH